MPSFWAAPRSLPRGAVQQCVGHGGRRGLTTGDAYRLLAGGADEVTGVGSALGYAVYPDFCLCGRTRKSVSRREHRHSRPSLHTQPSPNI